MTTIDQWNNKFDYITSLIEKGVFYASPFGAYYAGNRKRKTKIKNYKKSELINESIGFTPEFMGIIFNEEISGPGEDTTPESQNPLKSIDNYNLELVKVTDQISDLILPVEVIDVIKTNLSLFNLDINSSENVLSAVNHEYFDDAIVNQFNNRRPFLFYGESGTGKTFAAGCVANHLGKDILRTDISKIQSRWMGESEKAITFIFDKVKEINETVDNPPILLLNEADQFLYKRINNIKHSSDHHYNNLRNLFLEALEEVNGLVIATTNNIENLDIAFSRRFDLKLNFPKPQFAERKKLWDLYLNKSIPGANNIDVDHISKRYEFTGGQINLVIKNTVLNAIASSCSNKISHQDIVKFCDLEFDNGFDKTNKIGFI